MIGEAHESMERNDMRRLYATSISMRDKTAPMPTMCHEWEGNLLVDRTIGAARPSWKKLIEDMINGNKEGSSCSRSIKVLRFFLRLVSF